MPHTDIACVSHALLAHCKDYPLDFGEYNKKDRAQAISGEGMLNVNVQNLVNEWIAKVDDLCRVCVSTLKAGMQDALANDQDIKVNQSACSDAAFTKFLIKQVVVIFLHYRRLGQRPELLEACQRKMDKDRAEMLAAFVAKGPGDATEEPAAPRNVNGDVLVKALSAIFADAEAAFNDDEEQPPGEGEDRAALKRPAGQDLKDTLPSAKKASPVNTSPPKPVAKKPAGATLRWARLRAKASAVAAPPHGRRGLAQAAKKPEAAEAAEPKFARVGGGKAGSYCQVLHEGRWVSVGNCTRASDASHRKLMEKLRDWVLLQGSPLIPLDACRAKCAELKSKASCSGPGVAKRPAAAPATASVVGAKKRPAVPDEPEADKPEADDDEDEDEDEEEEEEEEEQENPEDVESEPEADEDPQRRPAAAPARPGEEDHPRALQRQRSHTPPPTPDQIKRRATRASPERFTDSARDRFIRSDSAFPSTWNAAWVLND